MRKLLSRLFNIKARYRLPLSKKCEKVSDDLNGSFFMSDYDWERLGIKDGKVWARENMSRRMVVARYCSKTKLTDH